MCTTYEYVTPQSPYIHANIRANICKGTCDFARQAILVLITYVRKKHRKIRHIKPNRQTGRATSEEQLLVLMGANRRNGSNGAD